MLYHWAKNWLLWTTKPSFLSKRIIYIDVFSRKTRICILKYYLKHHTACDDFDDLYHQIHAEGVELRLKVKKLSCEAGYDWPDLTLVTTVDCSHTVSMQI